jgi:hypothetical protein
MNKAEAIALVASDYAGKVDTPAEKQAPAVVAPTRQARHLAA